MIQSLRDITNTNPAQNILENSLGARFARGAFWSFVAAILSQGIGMAASIVTARFLGKEGFGEFGMIISTVGAFGIFAGLGLGLTATKFVAEYRATDPARVARILGLSFQVAYLSSGFVSIV
ncbi:MAG: oligosaccharide flippase family protein, partial [Syntrophales bacterium LBB04]|nr:oligosaccharide flippase family protein [Syntrophales bacterium LBB04]